jgi:hypothetical protein
MHRFNAMRANWARLTAQLAIFTLMMALTQIPASAKNDTMFISRPSADAFKVILSSCAAGTHIGVATLRIPLFSSIEAIHHGRRLVPQRRF